MATRVVFRLSVSRPVTRSALGLFTGGCSRLRHAHLRRTSRIRPTLTQHHARTGPSLSLTERVHPDPLCGYLPHHLVEPLLFGSVPHRPSPRHCLDASHSGRPSSQRTPIFTADAHLHSGRPSHENGSSQPSLCPLPRASLRAHCGSPEGAVAIESTGSMDETWTKPVLARQ